MFGIGSSRCDSGGFIHPLDPFTGGGVLGRRSVVFNPYATATATALVHPSLLYNDEHCHHSTATAFAAANAAEIAYNRASLEYGRRERSAKAKRIAESLKEGNEYVEHNNIDAAIICFKNVLEEDKEHLQANLKLADIYRNRSEVDLEEFHLRTVHKKDYNACIRLADVYIDKSNHSHAKTMLHRVFRLYTDNRRDHNGISLETITAVIKKLIQCCLKLEQYRNVLVCYVSLSDINSKSFGKAEMDTLLVAMQNYFGGQNKPLTNDHLSTWAQVCRQFPELTISSELKSTIQEAQDNIVNQWEKEFAVIAGQTDRTYKNMCTQSEKLNAMLKQIRNDANRYQFTELPKIVNLCARMRKCVDEFKPKSNLNLKPSEFIRIVKASATPVTSSCCCLPRWKMKYKRAKIDALCSAIETRFSDKEQSGESILKMLQFGVNIDGKETSLCAVMTQNRYSNKHELSTATYQKFVSNLSRHHFMLPHEVASTIREISVVQSCRNVVGVSPNRLRGM